jgi:hypothetical protein
MEKKMELSNGSDFDLAVLKVAKKLEIPPKMVREIYMEMMDRGEITTIITFDSFGKLNVGIVKSAFSPKTDKEIEDDENDDLTESLDEETESSDSDDEDDDSDDEEIPGDENSEDDEDEDENS